MAEFVVLKPGDLAAAVKQGVRSLVPETVRDLDKLTRFVIGAVAGWFVTVFVNPFVNAIIGTTEAIIGAMRTIAFGAPDGSLGTADGVGLADLAFVGVGLLLDATRPVAMATLAAVGSINRAVAGVAAEAGIAAPVVLTGLYMVEVAALLYGSWYVIRIADVPLINLGPTLKLLTAPFRWFLRAVS